MPLYKTKVANVDLVTTDGDIGGAWKTWSPTVTGFSGTPTVELARYTVHGKTCTLCISINGTSNASTFTFTLPVNAIATYTPDFYARVIDNTSTYLTGLVEISNATTAGVYTNPAGDAFTTSGSKRLYNFTCTYETA